MFTLDFH